MAAFLRVVACAALLMAASASGAASDAASRTVATAGLAVDVSADGATVTVSVGGAKWFASTDVGIHAGGNYLAVSNGGVEAAGSCSSTAGADVFGSFNSTACPWTATAPNGATIAFNTFVIANLVFR